jgi:hypothetical protein
MSNVLTSHVGAFDLWDLNVISSFIGRDFMPYPFMFTRPSRFATGEEANAYALTVPDRLQHGDLNHFFESVTAYDAADIRVECHVQYLTPDTPSTRLLACRRADKGYFGVQRPDADIVEVYTLSPYDLSTAICEALALSQPGRHPEIIIPEYIREPRATFDDGEALVVREVAESTDRVSIPAAEVTAYSKIQSHWRQTRRWGPDPGKRMLVWVQINDDGDYLYVPDYSYAQPMTAFTLQAQIDRLIAEDIARLNDFRQ